MNKSDEGFFETLLPTKSEVFDKLKEVFYKMGEPIEDGALLCLTDSVYAEIVAFGRNVAQYRWE